MGGADERDVMRVRFLILRPGALLAEIECKLIRGAGWELVLSRAAAGFLQVDSQSPSDGQL